MALGTALWCLQLQASYDLISLSSPGWQHQRMDTPVKKIFYGNVVTVDPVDASFSRVVQLMKFPPAAIAIRINDSSYTV